jgi:hypothetical protein
MAKRLSFTLERLPENANSVLPEMDSKADAPYLEADQVAGDPVSPPAPAAPRAR